jgi:hypothetical protein
MNPDDRHSERGPSSTQLVIGFIFILTGAWLLVREFAPEFEPTRSWPIAIVALGVILLVASLLSRAARRKEGPR